MEPFDRYVQQELNCYLGRAHIERSQAFFALARKIGRGLRGLAKFAEDLVRQLGTRLARSNERRRNIAALASLDRTMLRDIGLLPSNIGAAVTDRTLIANVKRVSVLSVVESAAANDDRPRPQLRVAN